MSVRSPRAVSGLSTRGDRTSRPAGSRRSGPTRRPRASPPRAPARPPGRCRRPRSRRRRPGRALRRAPPTSAPSRRTRALMNIIFWSAATASAALPSWWSPRIALKTVREQDRRCPCRTGGAARCSPMPTTSSTICIASRYWRTNARQRGSDFASANLFGPYCCRARRHLAGGETLRLVDAELRRHLGGVDGEPGRLLCGGCHGGHVGAPSEMSGPGWAGSASSTIASSPTPDRQGRFTCREKSRADEISP